MRKAKIKKGFKLAYQGILFINSLIYCTTWTHFEKLQHRRQDFGDKTISYAEDREYITVFSKET